VIVGDPAELVVDAAALCGESPLWDGRRLLWNDMNSARVFEYDPDTGSNRAISDGLPVAGMALNVNGLLILAGSGLHLWREPGVFRTIVTEHEGERLNFNDILADSHGRVYAGTYHMGNCGIEKPGKLYRIDPGGEIVVLDTELLLANGLGLSPDQETLYLADSIARRIYSYRVDPLTGDVGPRTTFVRVPPTEGMPDGLTVDAEGFLWSAQWHGGRVVRYTPDGSIDQLVPIPASQVASLTFGGPVLEDLYVTTASELWTTEVMPPEFDASRPLGGGLYRIHPGVAGLREHRASFDWFDD
jgi:sugar lactone lactonase YvrE